MKKFAPEFGAGLLLLTIPFFTVAALAAPVQSSGKNSVSHHQRTVQVQISTADQVVKGTGAWFEKGKILTASHFFRGIKPEDIQGIAVIWQGAEFKVDIERIENPIVLDAAILVLADGTNLDVAWMGDRPTFCDVPLRPAQPVFVLLALPGFAGTMPFLTYGSPDAVDPLRPSSGTKALTAHFPQGASGANVYDSSAACLVGLVSKKRKSTKNGVDVYITDIVPAAELKAFVEQ